jgi:hypothetical protein
MVPAATQDRAGKTEDGRARTREVKMACLFTQAATDDNGFPVRDPGSSSYLATFDPVGRFGQLVDAEARRRGSEHIRQLVVLGDGAVWIWNLAGELFPAATQIVDLYHAREHVHELANLAARLLAGHRDEWLAARLAELDAGDVPALLAAGRGLRFTGSLARERDKTLGYFETNAHRMRYQHFRALGLFIGSGTVEAGCKHVIGQRLKLSGMRWNIPGATGIATCAARTPATAGKKSGSDRTTRPAQPGTPSENASTLRTRRQRQATRQSPTELSRAPALAHIAMELSASVGNVAL